MTSSAGTEPPFAILTESPAFDSAFGGKPAPGPRLDKPPASPLCPTNLSVSDRSFLLCLQRHSLQYFIDNQMPNGLVLDRQCNHGNLRTYGLCSTATTGMGFIALALAASSPHHLISRSVAIERITRGMVTAIEQLPHDEGMLPHFIDAVTQAVQGHDCFSTIDSAWFVAGALTAAALLKDDGIGRLADSLYQRINWHYWTHPEAPLCKGLLRHGKRKGGHFLGCSWDRYNGETLFMYVLGAGAAERRALTAQSFQELRPFTGSVAGFHFCSADLGLFVFQYSLDLLDLSQWKAPREHDLWTEAHMATLANRQFCHDLADQFETYKSHWGLSAGDGPGHHPDMDQYRCYSASGPVDGTAHLTATLASMAHCPDLVLENLRRADHGQGPPSRGRFGYSNINHGCDWVSRDMVGIDVGAAALALDNYLMENRVRQAFHEIPWVQQGLQKIGFSRTPGAPEARVGQVRQAS